MVISSESSIIIDSKHLIFIYKKYNKKFILPKQKKFAIFIAGKDVENLFFLESYLTISYKSLYFNDLYDTNFYFLKTKVLNCSTEILN